MTERALPPRRRFGDPPCRCEYLGPTRDPGVRQCLACGALYETRVLTGPLFKLEDAPQRRRAAS